MGVDLDALFCQRKEFIEVLLGYNNTYRNKIFSVFGSWGSGKSFLIDEIVRINKTDKSLNIIKFDAWKHQANKDINAIFLETIYDELKENYFNNDSFFTYLVNNHAEILKKTGKVLIKALPFNNLTNGIVEESVEVIGHFKNTKTYEYYGNEILNDFIEEKEFYEILLDLIFLKKSKEDNEINKCLIIIDELDRCEPKFALELIKKVVYINKLIENKEENVNFLISFNRIEFKSILNHYYGFNYSAEQYFDKIFDAEFELPEGCGRIEYLNLLTGGLLKDGLVRVDYSEFEEELQEELNNKCFKMFNSLNYRKIRNLSNELKENSIIKDTINIRNPKERLTLIIHIIKTYDYEAFFNIRNRVKNIRADKNLMFNFQGNIDLVGIHDYRFFNNILEDFKYINDYIAEPHMPLPLVPEFINVETPVNIKDDFRRELHKISSCLSLLVLDQTLI